MTVHDDLATLRRRITNYASVSQDYEGFAALSRVEAEIARLGQERDAVHVLLEDRTAVLLHAQAERVAAEAALADMRRALERIAGQDCERFTDADPRECVETKRDPCDRCVALAAVIAEETRVLLADQDGAACDHGITLRNKQTGRERCAKCGAAIEDGAA